MPNVEAHTNAATAAGTAIGSGLLVGIDPFPLVTSVIASWIVLSFVDTVPFRKIILPGIGIPLLTSVFTPLLINTITHYATWLTGTQFLDAAVSAMFAAFLSSLFFKEVRQFITEKFSFGGRG